MSLQWAPSAIPLRRRWTTSTQHGEKVGLVKVRLYRPFSAKHLIEALPKSRQERFPCLTAPRSPARWVSRSISMSAPPCNGSAFETVPVYGGRYGLGSKDTTPGQIVAVYRNMEARAAQKALHHRYRRRCDPSLPEGQAKTWTPRREGTHSCKFWGLGSDGTVGANKNSIKIIGDHTDMYAQGYFAYDSKKSGGVTISHLRFGKKPIKSTYFDQSRRISWPATTPPMSTSMTWCQDVKPGGIFLLNCSWDAAESSRNACPPP